MASIVSANIDLTKINKSKIYEGKKGKYYPITIVLNDEPGQYGDSGYIMISFRIHKYLSFELQSSKRGGMNYCISISLKR